MTDPRRYAWHADSFDPALASIRYRLLAPMAALQAAGVAIERYAGADVATYDAIVFSKSQSVQAVALAQAARAAGRGVVYDLCDNLFAAHAVGHASAARVARVRAMLGLATQLTFSTERLRAQINEAVPGLSVPQTLVPDAIDVDPPVFPPALSWRARFDVARVRRFLARHDGALHCVWFGKSLGDASGYAHLGAAVAELERFGHPVTLTVMSNAALKFRAAARGWRVPVQYVPWRLATARGVLALHRVAVIPVETNDYTAGKTLNRPATALLAGLGVVGDAIPSYEELRPFVVLDDWQRGLTTYRDWSAETQAVLAAGRAELVARYSPDAVAVDWAEVLAGV